jgi:predicted RNA-binding Zn ribbon-like protein
MKALRIDKDESAGPTARTDPELSLVAAAAPAQRARQLLVAAKAASLEHLAVLRESIDATRELSEAVVQGGDLYPAGLSDFVKRFSEELLWRSRTLEALADRQRAALGR